MHYFRVQRYYFMAQGAVPADQHNDLVQGPFRVIPRRWHVSTWDWALLATEHELHLPFQLPDLEAQSVNLELAVEADSVRTAVTMVEALRLALACHGLVPVSTPTICSHSVNDFSGIKQFAKDTSDPRHGRALAIASRSETVWMAGIRGGPVAILPESATRELSESVFAPSASMALRWLDIAKGAPRLRVLEEAALTAPTITNLGQSILQMWTGLESLFPEIHSELSFRLALHLAQLDPATRRAQFARARKAYVLRSKVAHGHDLSEPSQKNRDAWTECWELLHSTVMALIVRGGLPTEEQLVEELLT
ncbi:MAG TPA: hypothetical protein DCM67_01780 [Propionibacteriaceae bacterium]|nr:hypothetical protein [Propionibacteriaceae bacterium]